MVTPCSGLWNCCGGLKLFYHHMNRAATSRVDYEHIHWDRFQLRSLEKGEHGVRKWVKQLQSKVGSSTFEISCAHGTCSTRVLHSSRCSLERCVDLNASFKPCIRGNRGVFSNGQKCVVSSALSSLQTASGTNVGHIESESSVILNIEGMMCGGCVARVRNLLTSDSRVASVAVNMLTETAAIRLNPPVGSSLDVLADLADQLASHLTLCGFPSKRREAGDPDGNLVRKRKELSRSREILLRKSQGQVAFAWVLVALCCGTHATHLLHSLGIHMFMEGHNLGFLHDPLWKFSMASVALLGPGRELLVDGAKAILRSSPNMNSLVGIGACAAFAISSVALAIPGLHWDASFFDEPVMLLALVLLGRSLEGQARAEASSSMHDLLSLVPSTSRLVVSEGRLDDTSEKECWSSDDLVVNVPTEQVRVADCVLVLPGETVPVDGKVISGRSAVDESMFTGEPLLVLKTKGASVSAGTMNWEGPIRVEASATGVLSTVSRIIQMVEEAQGREAPVQRLADVVAGPFALMIMALSGATFSFWYLLGTKLFPDVLLNDAAGPDCSPLLLSLKLAINVLVVACPCALGLATPTAVLVGTSLGAKQGLLIRGGDVLERLAGVNAVIFDKTGTLTTGQPTLAATAALDGYDQESIMQLAATVERNTVHPFATAIVRGADALHLNILSAEGQLTEPGYGALARVNGKIVAVGLFDWVHGCCNAGTQPDKSISCADSEGYLRQCLNRSMNSLSLQQSQTVVFVGVEGKGVVGAIALTDTLRTEAREAVQRLQKMGTELFVLSGDKMESVGRVAAEVGIRRVHAELRPQDKSRFISSLKENGSCVVMVGDGVNDAPALACADVGIALKMRDGLDAASDAASVILLGSHLSQVVDVINLAQATLAKVHQNLLWALIYNLVSIPLAAGVLLPAFDFALTPSTAGGMMAFSSILVVSNSLLLRLQRPPSV